jgi:hypothetical protein
LNAIVSKKRNPHIGGSLDDFLKEEGIFEETQAQAMEVFADLGVTRPRGRASLILLNSIGL